MTTRRKIGWITDGRPVPGPVSTRHDWEEIALARSPVECGTPDLTGLEDRIRAGSFDALWIHVEAEAVYAVSRVALRCRVPTLVSSPAGAAEADLAAVAGVAHYAATHLALASGFAASQALALLLPRDDRKVAPPVGARLETAVGCDFRQALASRASRETLLAAVVDAFALARTVGLRWTGVRVADDVAPGYWQTLRVLLDLDGGGEAELVFRSGDDRGTTTLDLAHADSTVRWHSVPDGEVLEVRRGKGCARRTFPASRDRDAVVDWFTGWFAVSPCEPHRGVVDCMATFAEALDVVDRYLHGRLIELARLDFESRRAPFAAAAGDLVDLRVVQGLTQSSLLVSPGPVLSGPLPGPAPRLLLVRMPFGGSRLSENVVPSLGLAILAAVARQAGAEVDVVDLAPLVLRTMGGGATPVRQEDFERAVAAKTGGRTYDVAGISVVSGEWWPGIERLARWMRGTIATKVVLGGNGLPQIDLEQASASGVIDACVTADGEAGLLALLRQVHGTVDPDAVPGLWLPGRETNPTCLTDFTTNPLPDYDGLDLGVYRSGKPSIRTPFLLYRFVNGCPQRCAFCSDRNGQAPGILSPDRIVSDLRALRDRYGVHDFLFMNNLFNPTPRFTEALLDALERADLGIRWCDCGRPAS
jgi:hypothetical protein